MNDSIIDFLKSCFVRLYQLGSTIYIYNDNGIQISLISFILALAIMTIVLTSLINTVRYRVGSGVSDAVYDKGIFGQRSSKNEENN